MDETPTEVDLPLPQDTSVKPANVKPEKSTKQKPVTKNKTKPPKVSERVTKDIESNKQEEPKFKDIEEATQYISEVEQLKDYYEKEAVDSPSEEVTKKLDRINIQLFAAAEVKQRMLSKFYDNFMKAESVPEYVKDMFKVDNFEYMPETNEQQINEAWKNIQADRKGIEQQLDNDPASRPGGVGTAESFIIWKSYMREYDTAKKTYEGNKTKDNKRTMLQLEKQVKKWLSIVRKKRYSSRAYSSNIFYV